MVYKELYKARRTLKLSESLNRRSQNVVADRQEKQREYFWSKRTKTDPAESSTSEPLERKQKTRAEMLKKWKAEKLKRLEETMKKKKPAFKVGVIQRTATGSPLIKNSKCSLKKNLLIIDQQKSQDIALEESNGVMTRARLKAKQDITHTDLKLCKDLHKVRQNNKINIPLQSKFCKIDNGKVKSLDCYNFKIPKSVSELPFCKSLTYPYSPKINKISKSDKLKIKQENENIKTENYNKTLVEDKASEENLKESVLNQKNVKVKSVLEEEYTPIEISPSVIPRSKELKIKSKNKMLPTIVELKEDNENIHKVKVFRNYVISETSKLLNMCDKWKQVYDECEEIPVDIKGEINSVIGKTKLLTSDKFQQFQDLIDKCENGDPLIKVDDLQGFQDWVSIEVERIQNDFCRLEVCKNNEWNEQKTELCELKIQNNKFKKSTHKKPVGKSKIHSHIAAMRKKLKDENQYNNSISYDFLINKSDVDVKEDGSAKKKKKISTKSSPKFTVEENNELEVIQFPKKKRLSSSKSLHNTPIKTEELLVNNENTTPLKSILRKTPRSVNSKNRVFFKQEVENVCRKRRGIDEKYFKPLPENEETPVRLVLGDLKNL